MKDIFKNAYTKTKNVMTKIISFLKAKRFSIITLIITLILCLDIYSCIKQPNARQPTTAKADDTYIEPTYLSDVYVVQTLGNVQFVSSGKQLSYVWSPIITFTCDNLDTDHTFLNISYPKEDGTLEWFHIETSPYIADYEYSSEGIVSAHTYLINNINNNSRVRGFLTIEYQIIIEEELHAYLPFYEFRCTSSNLLFGNGSGNVNLVLYCTFKPDNSSITYSLNSISTTLLETRTFDISEMTKDANTSGYDEGYDEGYEDGLDSVFEDVSPFEMISSSISSLLDIEILPNFKLSNILLIAFGFIMVAIILKFLHG